MSVTGGMVICVHLPRFELQIAAGGPEALAGETLAIAPTGGGQQRIGEVSASAQACGVLMGMGLGEALARCPRLVLVPGDPVGVAEAWESAARALEGIGAEVELPRPGLAYFNAAGLRGLYGDTYAVIAATRMALKRPSRIGAGPARFCALAAALEARSSRARVIDQRATRRYLAESPVELLSNHRQTAALVQPLQQLGIDTLGQLAALGADGVADRFGRPGILARQLALGADEPLRTRHPEDQLRESMVLTQSNSREALEHALGVLIDRLLARPERRGRGIRALTLSARLLERGTWCEPVVFREAMGDRVRMRLALAVRLRLLPAPAETLSLTVRAFGGGTGDQDTLLDGERTARLARLREAINQIRMVAGTNATLRTMLVDPRSRVPERRFVFTPYMQ